MGGRQRVAGHTFADDLHASTPSLKPVFKQTLSTEHNVTKLSISSTEHSIFDGPPGHKNVAKKRLLKGQKRYTSNLKIEQGKHIDFDRLPLVSQLNN